MYVDIYKLHDEVCTVYVFYVITALDTADPPSLMRYLYT